MERYIIFLLIISFLLGISINYPFHKEPVKTVILDLCYNELQPSGYFKDKIEANYFTKLTKESIYSVINDNSIKVWTILNTGSMRPSISDNSIILMKFNLTEKDIQVGDIILTNFKPVDLEGINYSVIHRVINISILNNESVYMTKGDNLPDIDYDKLTINNISAKVVGVLY